MHERDELSQQRQNNPAWHLPWPDQYSMLHRIFVFAEIKRNVFWEWVVRTGVISKVPLVSVVS